MPTTLNKEMTLSRNLKREREIRECDVGQMERRELTMEFRF